MINFTNEITFISSLRSNRCLRRDMRLVMQVCERDLSLILDVVHHTIQEERSRGDYYPLPGSDCPDWCVCGRCREMSSEEKGECCRQTPVNCICSQPVIFFFRLSCPLKYDWVCTQMQFKSTKYAIFEGFWLHSDWSFGFIGGSLVQAKINSLLHCLGFKNVGLSW